MMGWVLLLALAQDPAETEFEELARRLREIAETVRDERAPAPVRVEAAENLLRLRDRDSWVDEIGRLALDPELDPGLRARASLLLAEAGDPRAVALVRELDEALAASGTDAAAESLSDRVRRGAPGERQLHEIDLLVAMGTPASRRELAGLYADPALAPSLRLAVLEKLHDAGRLERGAGVLSVLAQVRAADSSLAGRADALAAALPGGRAEEPRSSLAREPARSAPRRASAADDDGGAPAWKVNLVVGAVALACFAALRLLRRRA